MTEYPSIQISPMRTLKDHLKTFRANLRLKSIKGGVVDLNGRSSSYSRGYSKKAIENDFIRIYKFSRTLSMAFSFNFLTSNKDSHIPLEMQTMQVSFQEIENDNKDDKTFISSKKLNLNEAKDLFRKLNAFLKDEKSDDPSSLYKNIITFLIENKYIEFMTEENFEQKLIEYAGKELSEYKKIKKLRDKAKKDSDTARKIYLEAWENSDEEKRIRKLTKDLQLAKEALEKKKYNMPERKKMQEYLVEYKAYNKSMLLNKDIVEKEAKNISINSSLTQKMVSEILKDIME